MRERERENGAESAAVLFCYDYRGVIVLGFSFSDTALDKSAEDENATLGLE